MPHSRLPRLVEGIDLRQLPIGPAEAFVLAHVDGTANETEIADEVGIELEAARDTLETLARLGAIWFDRAAVGESPRAAPSRPRSSDPTRIGAIVETSGPSEPQHPAAALYDARELDEVVDIEPERKRVILDTFYRLDSITHYQILQVDPSADKRTIKNAYFQVVNIYHPDRYFGKTLGSFKVKLERVFARLTDAHDALTRAGPRAEYDAYLASRNKTRALDHNDDAVRAQIQAIQQQIEEELRAAEHGFGLASENSGIRAVAPESHAPPAPSHAPPALSHAPPAPSHAPPTPSHAPPARSNSGVRLPSQRPVDANERKRALARKLGGRNLSGSLSAVSTPSMAPAQAGEARERAATDLKRRYEQRMKQALVDRAERYLTNARQSLSSKDPISAANALRIAASLVPDNPEIISRLEEARNEAEALLSDHYLNQAEYEERDGRMAEAARSYARASLGGPKARTFERAAYCALMASADLRIAGDHARRAVALAPDDVQTRVTLARIYVAAGMKQSGLAEFERAATLAPKDDTIRDWIRRLKRGEA